MEKEMEEKENKEQKEEEIVKDSKINVDNNNDNNDQIRCVKCGSLLNKDNKFCVNCGFDQNTVIKKKKREKNKGIKSYHIIISCVITLFISVFSTILILYFIDDNSINIDTSNKNVTITDTGIADAVEKVYDSVVVIENHVNNRLYATGSGFVYKTDDKYGYILTNYHVIQNATEVYAQFTDDEKAQVEVVGSDDYSDIAVLRVDKKYVKQVAIIGDNDEMRVGDTTFAVGTPLDSSTYSWTVTRGILSGKDRLVSDSNSYMTVLQTDTPINSGNSGGPLCNANGEVIGITNMKLASDEIEGMGFAIPIETAIEYADKFVEGEDVRRPYIGVAIYDNTSFFGTETQVVVESVEKDSPAEDAGMRAGDIISKVNDETVENSSHFKYELYSYDIGDEVEITVIRNGKEQTLKIKLASNAEDA